MTKNDNLSFELISDPELIRFTHLQNSNQWRFKLTADEYADREWVCGVVHNPRDYDSLIGLYHFVLRDLSIPNDGSKFNTSNIVAACETRNRYGWRIEPNGELKQVLSLCIGGVYTMINHRKKGYAAEMISRLNEYWNEKAPKDAFMTLYSEVGEFYSRVGYKSFDVLPHHVKVPQSLPSIDLGNNEFHYLKPKEYSKVIEKEHEKLKQRLVEKSKTSDKTLVSLQYDIDTFTWFHIRDEFIGSKLKPGLKIERFGALLDDRSEDFVVWLHDWNDNELMIVAMKYSNIESFKHLTNIALKEAKDLELTEVTFWDSVLALPQEGELYKDTYDYIQSFEGTETSPTNTSLPAIRLNDGTTNYQWENNDKWCWF